MCSNYAGGGGGVEKEKICVLKGPISKSAMWLQVVTMDVEPFVFLNPVDPLTGECRERVSKVNIATQGVEVSQFTFISNPSQGLN